MKIRMRRLAAVLMSLTLVTGLAYSAGAVTLDEAEKKADELEEQKKGA